MSQAVEAFRDGTAEEFEKRVEVGDIKIGKAEGRWMVANKKLPEEMGD